MGIKWAWVLRQWLPIAVGLTAMAAITYTAVQQDLRLTGNDPQIQMSEDAAAALASGRDAAAVVPADKVDVASSLTTFVIVLDEAGKPVAANVQLGGQVPIPPSGVFDAARARSQNRFTWQPAPGVRLATVVTHYSNGGRSGFVLVGRSLREIERREDVVRNLVGAGWALSLGATLVVCGVVAGVWGRGSGKHEE